MDDLHLILAPPDIGDRSSGQGGTYSRQTPRGRSALIRKLEAAPAVTEPAIDPVAPLLEALDRLRATEEPPKEPSSRRFVRGVQAYRETSSSEPTPVLGVPVLAPVANPAP